MWLILAAGLLLAQPGDELALNGGLETVHDGWPVDWSHGWCRAGEDKLSTELSQEAPHTGQNCLHLVHTGDQDWSVNGMPQMAVRAGDVFALSCWVKLLDQGQVTLCAMVLPPEGDQGAQWSAGGQTVRGPLPEWRQLTGVFVVAEGLTRATPRVIGHGPVDCYLDDISTIYRGNLSDLRKAYQGPAEASLQSKVLAVSVEPGTDALAVTDRRTKRVWRGLGDAALIPVSLAAKGETLVSEFDPVVREQHLVVTYELAQ